jgi:putative transposase
VSSIARALGVSRSHLSSSQRQVKTPRQVTHRGDDALAERMKELIQGRASYGYRRVAARLNASAPTSPRVNHKRAYRVMKKLGLLLPKFSGRKVRVHDGKVATLKSDLRFCSDAFEVRCLNGEKVHVAFVLDCCDREAITYVAEARPLVGSDVRDMMAGAVDKRFGATRCPHPVEWLSDNGPIYTAHETRSFGTSCGFIVTTTPAYSPESNGMAEAFVKTMKRDYIYVAEFEAVADPAALLRRLPGWFADYNENAPHKALGMVSPLAFRSQEVA